MTVGEAVRLLCNTDMDTAVDWTFQSEVSDKVFYIYSDGDLVRGYSERFYVETTKKGEYNLVIRHVTPGDSGLYTCTEDGGFGQRHLVRLKVTGATETVRSLTPYVAAIVSVVCVCLLLVAVIVYLAHKLRLCRKICQSINRRRVHINDNRVALLDAVHVTHLRRHPIAWRTLPCAVQRDVMGLTTIGNLLYVVFDNTDSVIVFNTYQGLQCVGDIKVKGLTVPAGFVSVEFDGKPRLMLGDRIQRCVWQIESTLTSKAIPERFLDFAELDCDQQIRSLHAMSSSNLLAVLMAIEDADGLRWQGRIDVYNVKKVRIRTVDMPIGVINPWSIAQTGSDTFLVSYGSAIDDVHGMLEMDGDKITARLHEELNTPLVCIHDDKKQVAIVADTNNNRVVVVSRSLELMHVFKKWKKDEQPTHVFYDKATSRLMVGLRGGVIEVYEIRNSDGE